MASGPPGGCEAVSTATLVTFCAYLMAMLGLGAVAWRVTANLSDYILGGRRLGPVVAALSAGASDMSGWLLLGLPGAVYAAGINQIWIAVGLTIGAWANWQVVAGRLRRYTVKAGDALTLPDFLENRFHDRTRVLRVVAAILILFFFTIYTSAGLVGGAILFEKSFGLDYRSALWIGTVVIVSYTFLGGFLAVSWTDVAQGLLMFGALLLAPLAAFDALGGWQETLSRVETLGVGRLDVFHDMSPIAIASLLAWGLGYVGQPHILARFMAIRSPAEIPTARAIGIAWMVLSLYGAIFTGLAASAFFADRPLANPETAFIALTQVLFNPWVAGILLAAILAAIMSTVDSQLLVASSVLAEDFYRAFIKPRAGERELVWIGRAGVATIAIVALFIGYDPESTVLGLVAYAWAGFGASFGPVVVLSLLWPRMTRNGALAGMATGGMTVVVWGELDGGLFDLYEILPGFLFGLAAAWLISILDHAPSSAITAEFVAD